MTFGIPTLIERSSVEQSASLCRELGLSFVELNMNLPAYTADALEKIDFSRLSREYGIFFTIHLDENLKVCDFDRDVATAYVNQAVRAIGVAVRNGFPVLNMHLDGGVHFTLPEEKVYLFERYTDEFMSSLSAFRAACEKAIGRSNTLVCIENTNGFKPYQQNAIDFLLQSDKFALTLDVGHLREAKNADLDFISARKNRLRHIHLHEYAFGSAHQPLGSNGDDARFGIRLAKECNCRCVIETKTVSALKQSVKWLSDNR